MVEEMPSYREVADALDGSGLGLEAAELHGGLCGLICGRGRSSSWLAEVLADPEVPAPGAGSALARLEAATAGHLADEGFGLVLLLPEEAAPLVVRGEALLGWCRGFVGGLGLSGAAGRLGEDASEALEDLARIATSEISCEDGEADEEALAEILEFVRVVAMLIHSDCLPPLRGPETLH